MKKPRNNPRANKSIIFSRTSAPVLGVCSRLCLCRPVPPDTSGGIVRSTWLFRHSSFLSHHSYSSSSFSFCRMMYLLEVLRRWILRSIFSSQFISYIPPLTRENRNNVTIKVSRFNPKFMRGILCIFMMMLYLLLSNVIILSSAILVVEPPDKYEEYDFPE